MSASNKRILQPEVSHGTKIAFFGPTTLLAREIRSLLETRGFPTSGVKLFGIEDKGALGDYRGEALVVTSPDEESIVGLDIAFMCGGSSETSRYLDWAERRGFVALDLSGASRGRPDVATVHTEINPEAIGPEAPIIASPHAVSHNLSSLIATVRQAGEIVQVDAVALRPASDMGEAAINELWKQTVALLNFSSLPQDVFGRQMAFNVLPSQSLPQSRAEDFDRRVLEEAAGILGMDAAIFSLTSAFVPVFHGHALFVAVAFDGPVEMKALAASMKSARGIRLVEDPGQFSPVGLAGEEEVAVLGPCEESHRPGRVSFWCFCDNLKGGAALNAARLAERVADMRRARE